MDPNMEEWQDCVPDLRHSRGQFSQYKQTVYLYYLMKNIVARALVTPSTGPSKTDTNFKEIHEGFQLIQFQIQQQNARLSDIEKQT